MAIPTVHERKTIRDAIAAALVAANTAASTRVFKSRLDPIRTIELPAICVYVDQETIDETSYQSGELRRDAVVSVDGWLAAAAADLDDGIDALALQIEGAMDKDPYFQNEAGEAAAAFSVLTATEITIKLEAERPMACVHLEYLVTYATRPRQVDAVDKFDVAGVKTSLSNAVHPDNQAQDLVEGINQEEED